MRTAPGANGFRAEIAIPPSCYAIHLPLHKGGDEREAYEGTTSEETAIE